MMIFIGLILLIMIWLYLDFQLGRSKHRRLVHKRDEPIFHGNFDILPHGKELFADYFQELKNAQSHIHILFYIVKDDQFTKEFFTILKTKAENGVEVRLLADRMGSFKIHQTIAEELRNAGVKIAFSNRIRLPYLFYSSQVRNHRKISVIDGKIGYLGSFNVGKEYVGNNPKLSPWRDYTLKITGESVPFLQQEFFYDWKEYSKEAFLDESAYFSEQPNGTVAHQLIPTEAGILEEKYLSLIKCAGKSITIGTPYFIPSKKIIDALILAATRGISITVVVPFKSDHILVKEASFRYLRMLLNEGAKVYQYMNGFYHAKSMIIDDNFCDIGTANFDQRSLFLNKEVNCYIHDSKFVERFRDIIRKDIEDSKPLTLAELNRPNLFRTVKEVIAGAVSYFL